MLAININNPDTERFIQEEFGNDEASLVSKFIEFVKLQKQKREITDSIEEIEKGNFYDIEEAFRLVSDKYVSN